MVVNQTGRGVRKVNENIMQDGRTIIITETDNDKLNWNRIPDGTLKVDPNTGQISIKISGASEWIPAGIKNDGSIQIVKDAKVSYEVFTIKKSKVNNSTFTYLNANGVERVGQLNKKGWQVFELEEGTYLPNKNRLEIIVDDTLHRTVASGGIEELDEERFALYPAEDGSEITVKYIENITAMSPYPRIHFGTTPPEVKEYGDLWLDLSES